MQSDEKVRPFCGAAAYWKHDFLGVSAMALTHPAQRLSEAQYLEIERAAEFKSEFFEGEMFAMAGGSPVHSLLASNLIRELGGHLKGRPYAVFNSDLRIKIEATGLLTYPDVSVICG